MEAAGSYYVGSLAAANARASWAWSSKHTNCHRVVSESASRPRSSQVQVCMSLTQSRTRACGRRVEQTRRVDGQPCVDGGATPRSASRAAQGAVSLVFGPAPCPIMMCIERASYQSRLHFQPISSCRANTDRGWRECSFAEQGAQDYADTQRLERDSGRKHLVRVCEMRFRANPTHHTLIKTYSFRVVIAPN